MAVARDMSLIIQDVRTAGEDTLDKEDEAAPDHIVIKEEDEEGDTQEEGEDFDCEEHLHRRRRSTEQEVRGGGLMSPHLRKRRDIGLSTTCCISSCTLRQLRLAC